MPLRLVGVVALALLLVAEVADPDGVSPLPVRPPLGHRGRRSEAGRLLPSAHCWMR